MPLKEKQRNNYVLAIHTSVLFMKFRRDLQESRDLHCWLRPQHNCIPSFTVVTILTVWRLLLRIHEMLSFWKATGHLTLDSCVYRTPSAAIKDIAAHLQTDVCFVSTCLFNLCFLCREEREYFLSLFLLKFQLLLQRDLSEKPWGTKAKELIVRCLTVCSECAWKILLFPPWSGFGWKCLPGNRKPMRKSEASVPCASPSPQIKDTQGLKLF